MAPPFRKTLIVCLVCFVLALGAVSRADAASVTLAWDANSEPDIAGYVLFYGTAPGAYTASVDAGLTTRWRVDGLVDSRLYYFAVRAYNSAGEVSDLSAEVSGVAAASLPRLSIDTPGQGATVPTGFLLGGWAVDLAATTSTGIDTLHVWAFPQSGATPIFVGVAPYGGSRPDVAATFGPQFEPSGFNAWVGTLAPGTYDLNVYAHSSITGTFTGAASARIKVQAPVSMPVITIDVPDSGSVLNKAFALGGWAADLASTSGGGVDVVHVWAYPRPGSGLAPVFVGYTVPGATRLDVAAVFGAQFEHTGYNLIVDLPRNTYMLVAYAHSTITGKFSAVASVDVSVK